MECLQMKVVRSIDVGYGLCKYTASVNANGEAECSSFPSIFPMAVESQVGREFEGQQRAVEIPVISESGAEVRYVVGPKAEHFLKAGFARPLDLEFTATAGYLALTRGCLHYMNEPVIDLLVVGLPVSNYKAKRAGLRSSLLGEHRLGGKRTVIVNDVLVIPQPVGALFHLLDSKGLLESARRDYSLVIDAGYLTLDFVGAKGTQLMPQYCGAHEGGASSILRHVADLINQRYGTRITEYLRIDEALRRNEPLRINGQVIDLKPFLASAEELASAAVNYMAQAIQSADTFDHIFLVGGGARWFRRALKAKFPNRSVDQPDESVYANVLGYQIIGTARAEQTTSAAPEEVAS